MMKRKCRKCGKTSYMEQVGVTSAGGEKLLCPACGAINYYYTRSVVPEVQRHNREWTIKKWKEKEEARR